MNPSKTGDVSVAAILGALRRRQRALNAVRWSVYGLLAGAVAGCAVGASVWLSGAGSVGTALAAAIGVLAGFGLLGAIAGAAAPINDLRLARALDRAADAEDRFASAVQLADHPRRARVELVVSDALARVAATPAEAALPLRVPRAARWIPVPLAALAAIVLLVPQSRLEAAAPATPEISPDEWAAMHEDFARQLAQLPQPQTPDEEDLLKDLQALADLLKQNPDKKDALTEIARLSERLERQRKAAGAQQRSMRSAAKALSSSEALKKFASSLKQGAYTDAAGNLRQLSKDMQEGKLAPDAGEFEAISEDLRRLAEELASEDELQGACENAADAAASMNREALAEALRRLAEQMERNADRMRQSDNLARCRSMLDELKRRMSQCTGQCKGCKDGCAQCEGGGAAGKGGRKPGWGSAAKWDGGSITKSDEARVPDVVSTFEGPGASTSFPMISPEEKARSGRDYAELYAEFVHKAEADLDLESVPVAYRDYLRRYFNAIRPDDSAPAADNAEEPAPAP